MNDKLGRVVYSRAGRDRGKPFIIIEVINEQYVVVADGDLRKVENPKLKNCRHLQFTQFVAQEVLQDIQKGKMPSNHVIRKNLKLIEEAQQTNGKEVW